MDWNLNQEVKEWWLTWSLHLINMLKGPRAKPSEPDWTMFWSANDLHETGHQRRATLVRLLILCYDLLMWNLSVSSDTSASPHEQIKPGVFCSAVCWHTAFEEDGLFWSDSSFAPPFSLWRPFLSSLCLPTFLFIGSEISEEAANGDQKGCYTLASVCCLTLSYTFFLMLFSVLTVPLLPEVFLSSSLSKCEESHSAKRKLQMLPSVVLLAGSMFFVWRFSALSLLPLHWDSIPALTVM